LRAVSSVVVCARSKKQATILLQAIHSTANGGWARLRQQAKCFMLVRHELQAFRHLLEYAPCGRFYGVIFSSMATRTTNVEWRDGRPRRHWVAHSLIPASTSSIDLHSTATELSSWWPMGVYEHLRRMKHLCSADETNQPTKSSVAFIYSNDPRPTEFLGIAP
jgi:hypothetical protein